MRLDAMRPASMGEAVKAAHIPIGDVLSSPTCRALQTMDLASLGKAKTFAGWTRRGGGHAGQCEGTRVCHGCRPRCCKRRAPGTNTFIVTHAPNIKDSFGIDAAAGETLVFRARRAEAAPA